MVRESTFYFVTWIQVPNFTFHAQSFSNNPGQLIHGKRYICANIKHSITSPSELNRLSDNWCHVPNVCKRPLLFTVAKNSHRLPFKKLIHKYPDNVTIAIADVLSLAIDIVRSKN